VKGINVIENKIDIVKNGTQLDHLQAQPSTLETSTRDMLLSPLMKFYS
jgi:hypothetical protein